MNAIVIVEKRCTVCRVVLPVKDFPLRSDRRSDARASRCRFCKSVADRARRENMRVEKRKEEYASKVDSGLPATTLQDQLMCVRLRKWCRRVQPNPRFGVGFNGGGYV